MADYPKLNWTMPPIRLDGLEDVGRAARRIGDTLRENMRQITVDMRPAGPSALNVQWNPEAEEIMKRFRAARADPDNPKSAPWIEGVGPLTPREVQSFWRYLPDPRAKRGRPKGRGRVVEDDEALQEMAALVDSGERPTAAARKVLAKRNVPAEQMKARADYLVQASRRLKKSG